MKINFYVLSVFILAGIFFSGCTSVDEEYKQTESYPTTLSPQEEPLMVHFIDVGQADAILVKYEDETMVVDVGDSDSADDLVSYLKKQDVYEIDHLVITHPHADHIGGFDEVVSSFDIKSYVDNGFTYDSEQYTNLKDYLSSHYINIISVETGDVLYKSNEITVDVLNPSKKHKNLNDDSVVLKITRGKVSVMLTGDIEKAAEEEMISTKSVLWNIQSTIVKAPHHGGNTSAYQQFFSYVRPDFVVVSVGANNQYGHPDKGAMELYNRYATTVTTEEYGTIVATIYSNKYDVITDSGSEWSFVV
jgi:beta-lactamase superfamily II metal-dependent hydrolase